MQKLTSDLKDAQSNLEETQYDKYISDQKSMLDEFYTDYEEALNRRLDDIDGLLIDITNTVNESSVDISETINGLADSVGYVISSEMHSVWGDNTVSDSVSSVIAAIKDASGVKALDEPNATQASSDSGNSDATDSPTANSNIATVTPAGTINIGGTIDAGSAKIYASSGGGNGVTQYFSDDPIYTVLDEENGYLLVRHHSLNSGLTGWFRKSDVKAYKKGGLIDYTGLAWVDGSQANPEYILDAETTSRLMSMSAMARATSESPLSLDGAGLYDFGIGNVYSGSFSNISRGLSGLIGTGQAGHGDVHVSNEINIPIDHVEDYEDFVSKLQNDSKFNDMILAMTIDPLVDGSSLGKYKYKW